ncbi:thaumatin-like protein 1b [Elaeis guineensis]
MPGGIALAISLLLILIAGSNSREFMVDNRCNYSVWLGTIPSMDLIIFEVPPKNVLLTNADDGWRGRIWLRTHCTTNSSGGFSCLTGDCHSGVESCDGKLAEAPVTLLDFTNFSNNDTLYVYAVNLLHGFNVPVVVQPQGGPSPCQATGCPEDIKKVCPVELQVTDTNGFTIACESECDKYHDPKVCCIDEYGSQDKCHPSGQADMFKRACPLAHTWTYDGGIFSCAGADFNITLCP